VLPIRNINLTAMRKTSATTTPDPSTAPAVEKVKLRATKKITAGGCVIAPGKEFHATPEKAQEMIAAQVAVAVPPSF
jgi:hypothetical protein